jgi:hypothetical protein
MELVDVRLTGIQRRNRAAFVRRSDIPGAPELTLGQKVVLRDEEGEYFAGTVLDLVDEARELFLVHLGVRLPEEFAMMRLGRQQGGAGSGQQQEVLDLLGDARDVLAGRMPVQRHA